jgi:hypothetical protein
MNETAEQIKQRYFLDEINKMIEGSGWKVYDYDEKKGEILVTLSKKIEN